MKIKQIKEWIGDHMYIDFAEGKSFFILFVLAIFAIPLSAYLYWLVFCCLPVQTSMLSITGRVENIKYCTTISAGGRGSRATTYTIFKLYAYPLPVVAKESVSGKLFSGIVSKVYKSNIEQDDEVTVWINKESIKNLSVDKQLYELMQKEPCDESLRKVLPQVYGLVNNGDEVVSPATSVWDNPSLLAIAFRVVVFIFWLYCIMNIVIGVNVIKRRIKKPHSS